MIARPGPPSPTRCKLMSMNAGLPSPDASPAAPDIDETRAFL